jgi:hypothetical protein
MFEPDLFNFFRKRVELELIIELDINLIKLNLFIFRKDSSLFTSYVN